ncbi:hypothetical protein COV58_02050 [Candidatus Roizmanbacteria bacterium CG11_big_fil_rev_8_21_14_0_20_36_8]|uniref:Uncharacterized protein n=2 Tax=Candidatus Roizmaniibacteriota TaxID=1752723 RepID=A0A2M6IUC9_9BACT|nr:MAG: hypothetical protein COV58_02050 [Candidatus Roizmanbacteria bacterium CG11_big_fil_rev_8_21_14_0_20_36_8]PIZ66283.1 MAG: hypothetical protein COY14_00600 [Candidatus Roizmanbacteria bacterium CG_4_10_14_0_2_um_filter_36_9]
MSSLKDPKTIIPLFIIIILIGAAVYFTYLISNGDDPLVLISSRASNGGSDNDLTSDPVDDLAYLTPTVLYTNTTLTPKASITPNVSEALNPTTTPISTPTISITVIITQIPTELPIVASLTPITQLPVAGINDFLIPIVIGSGALIIFALFL